VFTIVARVLAASGATARVASTQSADVRRFLNISSCKGSKLAMKKIEAIVRHYKVEQVKDALIALGLHGMTIGEVRGFGRQKGQTETYRGAEYRVDFVPKVKIEVVVDDGKLDAAVAAITKAAHSGQIGDGKIFITKLEEVVRIRTGETGTDAL